MVHAYYQYIVRAEPDFPLRRDEIVAKLNEAGVGCRPSYPMVLYRQKALRDRRITGKCPVAEQVVGRLFELPVHPSVTPKDVATIVDAVHGLL
jgi:dTDP-4-amino-4,6-dideoxygalactose transaminase